MFDKAMLLLTLCNVPAGIMTWSPGLMFVFYWTVMNLCW